MAYKTLYSNIYVLQRLHKRFFCGVIIIAVFLVLNNANFSSEKLALLRLKFLSFFDLIPPFGRCLAGLVGLGVFILRN